MVYGVRTPSQTSRALTRDDGPEAGSRLRASRVWAGKTAPGRAFVRLAGPSEPLPGAQPGCVSALFSLSGNPKGLRETAAARQVPRRPCNAGSAEQQPGSGHTPPFGVRAASWGGEIGGETLVGPHRGRTRLHRKAGSRLFALARPSKTLQNRFSSGGNSPSARPAVMVRLSGAQPERPCHRFSLSGTTRPGVRGFYSPPLHLRPATARNATTIVSCPGNPMARKHASSNVKKP